MKKIYNVVVTALFQTLDITKSLDSKHGLKQETFSSTMTDSVLKNSSFSSVDSFWLQIMKCLITNFKPQYYAKDM